MLLPGVEARSGPVAVEGEGVGVGMLVDGDAVLGGDDWPGVWFGVVVLGFWPGVGGVLAEGVLAGPELGVGLVADGVPPEVLGAWCVPAVAAPVEGATGDVGAAGPPSERPPVLVGDGSAVVGVDAAVDCVGALAARLSIWVPIEPPPGEGDVPPDDADADVGVGVDCGLGEDRPETGEPPRSARGRTCSECWRNRWSSQPPVIRRARGRRSPTGMAQSMAPAARTGCPGRTDPARNRIPTRSRKGAPRRHRGRRCRGRRCRRISRCLCSRRGCCRCWCASGWRSPIPANSCRRKRSWTTRSRTKRSRRARSWNSPARSAAAAAPR